MPTGGLRIQGCTECAALVHPPVPICPVCRSRAWEPTEVSGRATVVGYTVNQHQWHPAFEPPYVVAVVALAEDPGVRLTTTVVGCDPTEVAIGQEVSVRFEHHEDVWLPLFAPTGEPRRLDPVADPSALHPDLRSAPTGSSTARCCPASGARPSVAGCMVDPLSLTVDACLEAVADAGLELEDIDGLSTYPGAGRHGHERGRGHRGGRGAAPPPDLDQRRGRAPRPGRSGHRRHAGRVLRSLPARPVLPHGVGVDLRRPRPGRCRRRPGSSGPGAWRAPFGAMSAANWIAMNAHQYLHRYGAPREMLGLIALNGRANAARNPAAIYRDPMTMDDYLSARPITSPFGLYDCDVPCDGSIAVVVSEASTAADRPRPAVRIEAVGTQIIERVSWDQGTITHEPQVLGQAAHLWSRTDLRPGRRRPGPALRRLHLQRHLLARGPRVLRVR